MSLLFLNYDAILYVNEDLGKLCQHIKISFCLKTIQSLSFFTRKRRNVDTHTTPTVKVARLIHKSWLVFYYHHPQPKKCSLDRVCKRAHNLCFFSVSIPRISNLEKSNATKKGK